MQSWSGAQRRYYCLPRLPALRSGLGRRQGVGGSGSLMHDTRQVDELSHDLGESQEALERALRDGKSELEAAHEVARS